MDAIAGGVSLPVACEIGNISVFLFPWALGDEVPNWPKHLCAAGRCRNALICCPLVSIHACSHVGPRDWHSGETQYCVQGLFGFWANESMARLGEEKFEALHSLPCSHLRCLAGIQEQETLASNTRICLKASFALNEGEGKRQVGKDGIFEFVVRA
jgi:hypothetical protein